MNINKKIKKFFYSLAVFSSVIGSTATVVSCNENKRKELETEIEWDEFRMAAGNEELLNIVENTYPTGWQQSTEQDLTLSSSFHDDDTFIVTINIDRIVNSDSTTATFTIAFIPTFKYNVNQWVCNSGPVENKGSWGAFKAAAISEKPDNIIAEARKLGILQKYRWTYGTPSQTKWISSDKAEFDVYGGLGKGDIYKGMAGRPSVNDSKQEITVIISKLGKDGAYDSDPIKATISFLKGTDYQVNHWRFLKVEQIQSQKKFNYIIKHQATLAAAGFSAFENDNFAIIGNNNWGKDHASNHRIIDVLHAVGFYSFNRAPSFFWSAVGADGRAFKQNGRNVVESKIVFKFVDHNDKFYQLSFYFYFYFKNGVNGLAGGNTFNFTWIGKAHQD